jgi:invasion protein IalB
MVVQLKRLRIKVAIVSCVAVLGVTLAHAQQRTLAMYGDWTVSCATTSGAKSCGLVQVQKTNGGATVSQVGIGRGTKTDSLKMSIETSANVWVPTGVKLFTSVGAPAITAQFKWCISTRCLADVDLSDADIKNLRAKKEAGQIAYKDAVQMDVSIAVSFNGFSEALNALQQQ